MKVKLFHKEDFSSKGSSAHIECNFGKPFELLLKIQNFLLKF